MYILQISDLHITAESSIPLLREKLNSLVTALKPHVNNKSSVALCLLGDIVEQGDAGCYKMAEELIDGFYGQIQYLVDDEQLKLFAVPGNHDLCDNESGEKTLERFNGFLESIKCACPSYSDEQMIQEYDFGGYHFICLSSVKTGNYEYGELDYVRLNQCTTPSNTIMLVHHSLISSDNDDNAVIRNGYALQKFVEEHAIIALLHGHTHGCKRYTVGEDCQIIGVGPMFKSIPDISNQCNLINISGSKVNDIITLTYHGDRKTWDSNLTYYRHENNSYYGDSVYELYGKILKDAESDSLLPNLRFQVKQTFERFEEEIKSVFSSCLEDAKKWQSFAPPKDFDYTHGQLMCTNDTKWDEFAIRKLKENPTNKRTIIPLITKEDSFKSGDDKLVSFDVVQFGFLDDTMKDLYITVYMRALEVRHFLPINLCESFLMAKRIKDEIRSIERVTICIFAFRGEQKKNYGCYKKAKIDLLSESQLCKILADRDFATIKSMISEKAEMCDTVIDEKWIMNLKKAMNEFYDESNRETVCGGISDSLQKLENLKRARLHCSDYSKTLIEETQFSASLESLIGLLP